MDQQPLTLLQWLDLPCPDEDLDFLSWKSEIKYHSIDRTRAKMEYMKKTYNVIIRQTDFQFSCDPTYLKDNLITGIVKFTLEHKDFPGGAHSIIGMASFLMGQYNGGWSFAQIADSLATVKAFSKEFRHFGKGLNTEDTMKDMTAPKIQKPDNMGNTLKKFS